MPSRPVFKPLQLNDPRLDRLQANLAQYLAQLDDQVAGLVSPLVLPCTRDAQVTVQVLVDYRGPGGHTITLPFARTAGTGRAAFVHILNNGAAPITIAAAGKDTVNGAKTLALAVASAFLGMGNGEKAWSSVRTQVAPTISTEWYSPVLSAEALGAANVRNRSGNFSTGNKFSSTRALVCNGVRFYWKANGATTYTIRVRIWKGTSLATVDVPNVQASGVYTGVFPTPLQLTAYNTYAATMWETSGARLTDVDSTVSGPYGDVAIVGMIPTGPFTIAHSFARHAAGDAVPVTTSATNFYPVEPVFAPFLLE